MAVRVAVDAMGGDYAPAAVAEGGVRAARALGDSLEVLLFGPEAELRALMPEDVPGNVQIIDAPQVIGMAESPASAVKAKPDSSICRGIGAVKAGQADAFVSAGNTGAVMAASLFILGRIRGISRPAIVGIYPTVKGFCLVLDVGTNVDCKPEHLVQFAHMGSIFAERVLKRPDPVVALMNIGEEPGKGNEQAKRAFELLSNQESLRFRGNIEGRDLMEHAADVVVCDGFVGNIMLKIGESLAKILPAMVGASMASLGMSKEEQATVSLALDGVRKQFDFEEYGGVPLLGVNGTVLIGHGGSGPKAIDNIIRVAAETFRQDVPGSIAAAVT